MKNLQQPKIMDTSNISEKTTVDNRTNNAVLPLIRQFHQGVLTLQERKQKSMLEETTKNLVTNSLVHNNHKNGLIPGKKQEKTPLFRIRSLPAAPINIKNTEKKYDLPELEKEREPLRKIYMKKVEVCRSESCSVSRISTACHSIDGNTLEIRTKEPCQQLESNMFLKRDSSLNTTRTSKGCFSKQFIPSYAESRRRAIVLKNARNIHQQMLRLDVRK